MSAARQSAGPGNRTRQRKRELRPLLRTRRQALSAEYRRAASRQIQASLLELPEMQRARSLFAYISMGAEAQTHNLIRRLLAEGRIVCVPYLRDGETMVAGRLKTWTELTPGRFGILTPPARRAWSGRLRLALVPGLGFAPDGARLGAGRGYYDRWLARHPATRRIALAFERQMVAELPVEPFDAPMHRIVTERRLLAPATPA